MAAKSRHSTPRAVKSKVYKCQPHHCLLSCPSIKMSLYHIQAMHSQRTTVRPPFPPFF
uniref:Uncharacterized protein n=1 Tax=Anguilla anguilla TaxID=7936 RepID=A0A0E9T1J7_ANGAN